MSEQLSISHVVVLIGVRDKKTMDFIAASLSRSKSLVQILMRDLEEKRYVHNPYKKTGIRRKTARTLTQKGIRYLQENGYV